MMEVSGLYQIISVSVLYCTTELKASLSVSTTRTCFEFRQRLFCVLYMLLSLLRRRANARNVSYTPYPTGEKHIISTFVDQTRIQLTRQRRKNSFFKTSLTVFMYMHTTETAELLWKWGGPDKWLKVGEGRKGGWKHFFLVTLYNF